MYLISLHYLINLTRYCNNQLYDDDDEEEHDNNDDDDDDNISRSSSSGSSGCCGNINSERGIIDRRSANHSLFKKGRC